MLMMTKQKKKNNNNNSIKRLLITINVMGSAGPIRFLVNEDDLVAAVIHAALKSYAREGRLPILGNDTTAFALYCPHLRSDALSPWDIIGSHGVRNFILCKKPETDANRIRNSPSGGGSSWKAWFNKSLNLKISTH